MTTAFVQQGIVAITTIKVDIGFHASTNMNYVTAAATVSNNLGDPQEYLLTATKDYFNGFTVLCAANAFNDVVFVRGAFTEATD